MPSAKANTTEDVREALAGVTKPERLREVDALGMTLPTYAVMTAAANSDALVTFLTQLEGEPKQIIELLMGIGESQARSELRISAIESTLAALALRSGGTATSRASRTSPPV